MTVFAENFNQNVSTPLESISPWQRMFGEVNAFVTTGTGSSGLLKKDGSTAAAIVAYSIGAAGGAVQIVGGDLKFATGIGFFTNGSGVDAASFNGYFVRMQTGLTAARVYRVTNGNVTGESPVINVSGLANGDGITLRSDNSDPTKTVLTLYQNGTQLGTYTDTAANRKTGGVLGIMSNTTGGTSGSGVDNFTGNDGASVGASIMLTEVPEGFSWEGKRGTSSIPVSGTYANGVPTAIQARVIDRVTGNPVSGFDWQTVVTSPSGGAFTYTVSGLPRGGWYRHQVRFANDTSVRYDGANDFSVGTVVPLAGQSQLHKLRSDGAGTAGVPAFPTGMIASVLHAVTETPAGGAPCTATVTKITSATSVGSGLYSAAVQIWLDTGEPIMLVDINIPGTGLQDYTADAAIPGTTTPIRTGFLIPIMQACRGQTTAAICFWGTALISSEQTTPGWFATNIATFMGYLQAQLGFLPKLWIMPHPRSCDDDGLTNGKNWKLRNAQMQLALGGGDYGLAGFLLDWQMVDDGSPHQVPGLTGNIRGGTRMGRCISSAIMGANVPRFGPTVVEARFTSAAKTAIDITYDADIETPAGIIDNLPLFSVSTDNWAQTNNLPAVYEAGFTAAIVSARKVRLTKTSGAWTGNPRVDYCRSTPWDTEGGAFGGEANITTRLDQMLFGTDGFDGGRGLPASPPMGSGVVVQDFGAAPTYTTITATGSTVTLTKAQAATLRIKDKGTARAAGTGSESISLNWNRQTGDLTGNPVDGIRSKVTVA
jgi:hypothetical protein